MIYPQTVTAVYPLAQQLESKGLTVEPLTSTPVDQLFQAGHYPIHATNAGELPNIEDRIVMGSKFTELDKMPRHDIVMDEITEVVSTTLKNNLNLARSVINPMVKEVVGDVEKHLDYCESRSGDRVAIVPVELPPLLQKNAFSEMVQRYNETPFKSVKPRISFSENPSNDQLVTFLKTGVQSLDKDITEWASLLGLDVVRTVWDFLFSPLESGFVETIYPKLDIYSEFTPINLTIIAHLFARNLMSDPPLATNVSLDEYKDNMVDILSQTGRAIVQYIQRWANAEQRRQLLVVWPSRAGIQRDKVNIYVNKTVYDQWLSDGGEADCLLGSFVSNQEKGYQTLIDNKESYSKQWLTFYRTLKVEQNLNLFNDSIEGMRQAVAKQINHMDEDLLVVPREVYHARLNEALKSLGDRFYDRLLMTSRDVICQTIFPHTMGLRILKAIDSVGHDNPELNPREAATLATIEILGEWMANLCKIKPFTRKERLR